MEWLSSLKDRASRVLQQRNQKKRAAGCSEDDVEAPATKRSHSVQPDYEEEDEEEDIDLVCLL